MLSCFGCVQLFATLWTAAHQAPLSMGFSRQEYWSGLPFPTPGDLPDPGIKPMSFYVSRIADGFFTTDPPGKPIKLLYNPAIPLLGIYPEEAITEKDTCTPIFTATLFTIARTWRRQWHPTPVLLPGKSHGQRTLVDCSPWAS